jgi:3-oxoacyl-[acyl-carrier-protein] synthase II
VLSFAHSDPAADVLITGIGLVTPLGCSREATWRNLLACNTAGRELDCESIDEFEALCKISGLRIFGAPVDHAEVLNRLRSSTVVDRIPPGIAAAWNSEPLISMSLLALSEALEQAELPLAARAPERTAVVFGGSKGGMRTAERIVKSFRSTRMAELQPAECFRDPGPARRGFFECESSTDGYADDWTYSFQTDAATQAIAAVTGAVSASTCPVAACATGLISVLQGASMVHSGFCDVCITGSADAALRASVLSSFHRLRVTSRHREAASACRPFDESRDGFIVGEGSAVLVLESRRHAEARSAKPLAKLTGGGWLNDPTGLTQIDSSGAVVKELLSRVFTRRTLWPQVLSLHGTGTETNDLAEANGIRDFFGPAFGPPCFAVKGAIGHLLGAAGSVETALTVLSLCREQVPGTMNLRTQDPRCAIPLMRSPQGMPGLERIAKLSLGFGGHVACGVFERPD